MAFIAVASIDGSEYVVKPGDIRRVSELEDGCLLHFTGDKNTPIKASGSIEEFFDLNLTKTHLLITDRHNKKYCVKPGNIRRVHVGMGLAYSSVLFTGAGNYPIDVNESPRDFFIKYLEKP